MEGFDERGYLSARRWKPGDDPYTLYAFNQRESERIPSNRALRDTRHYRYTHTHTHTLSNLWKNMFVIQTLYSVVSIYGALQRIKAYQYSHKCKLQ